MTVDFARLKGQDCLLVGGGLIALEYGKQLNQAGAAIHVVAHEVDEELWWMAIDSGGSALLKAVDEHDFPERVLVVLASEDTAINQQAKAWAQQYGIATHG